MKKLSYLLTLFFVGLLVLSCRPEDPTVYEGEPFLYFQSEKASVNATDVGYTDYVVDFGTIKLLNSNATVKLVKVDGDAVEGTDFEILENATTSVASGTANGKFTVRVYGKGLSTETEKTATFELQSSEVKNAAYNQQFTIGMMLKCPLPADFAMKYTVSVFAFGEDAPSHEQELTLVEGTDDTFTLKSSWGPNYVAWATGSASYNGQYLYPGTLKFKCGNVVEFTTGASYGSDTVGTYDPATGVIKFTVQQSLFTSQFATAITMTPKK